MNDTLFCEAVPTIDPEGAAADADLLDDASWAVEEKSGVHCLWSKPAVQLRATVSEENSHRLVWELSIFAQSTQVAYAKTVLRPGDLSNRIISTLIKDAIKSGEEELKKWADALAESKKQIEAA